MLASAIRWTGLGAVTNAEDGLSLSMGNTNTQKQHRDLELNYRDANSLQFSYFVG